MTLVEGQSMQDYFEANLAVLRQYHPLAWQVVMDYSGQPLGELCRAEDGQVNLLLAGEGGAELYLHDNRSPELEITTYFDLVPEEATGAVLFVGMGLGYAPLAMLRSRKYLRHLAVIEPETGIFIHALHAKDLRELFSDRGAVIAIGPDIDLAVIMAPMGLALVLENFYILRHLPSFHFRMEKYQALHDEVFKLGNTLNVGGATTRIFGRKFIDNRFAHLSSIHHQQLLENVKDAFVGVPAIIVAAGPSLNKNIHLLPKAKGKAVIIAVDTVLPALLAQGVEPDFLTSIDMQDIVIEKIVDSADAVSETSLVCASWVSPSIPKNFPARQVYWTFAAKHMESWLNDLLGGRVLTAGAGTVAHLSFTTAVMLGCSPIIFIGQDLAFTGREDHVQLTSLTQKDELEGCYAANEIQLVEGYGGAVVPTNRGWLSDKHHFERMIGAYPDREFVNATEGGVRLEGTMELSLQETLSRYCQQEVEVADFLRKAERLGKMPVRSRVVLELGRQLKSIGEIERDMGRVSMVAAKLLREVAKLRKQGGQYHYNALPATMNRMIGDLDLLNNRLDKAPVWKLLDEVTMDGLLQSERLNHEIDLLEGKPECYLKWLSKNIERFILINKCRKEVLTPFKQQLKWLTDYLQREDFLVQKLVKDNGNHDGTVLELLRLYCRNGNHRLMEKLMQSNCSKDSESAELFYYRGIIAGYRSQFEQEDRCFSQAQTLDPRWSERIDECRRQLGTKYFDFGRQWQVNDRAVALRMFFKGIRHCVGHAQLGQTLIGQLEVVLAEAEAAANEGTLVQMEEILGRWGKELGCNRNLVTAVGRQRTVSLCRYYGNVLVARQEYVAAATVFSFVIALAPEVADLYLLLSDVYFAQGNYSAGVENLDRAVALDRQYAQYWENMGDNMFGSGQAEDALAAYERCLLALPENLLLLKKIGDCYMAMDRPEAALEAYRQCKAGAEQVRARG